MTDSTLDIAASEAPEAVVPASLASPPRSADEARVMLPVKRRVRLGELWSSRRVTLVLAVRDMKLKYKQSILGPVWLAIQPLGMLAAVAVAFSAVTGVDTGDVPYVLFALVGLSVWTFMQLAMSAAAQLMYMNNQLVRRSPCPRIALVNATLVSNLPPLVVVLAVTLGGLAIEGVLSVRLLALPALIVWLLVLTWAVALLIATIAARFRDTVSLIPLMLQAGVFISPVGYPVAEAPGGVQTLLALNPVTGLIEAWRWGLTDTQPALYMILIALAWTALLSVVSWAVFTRMEVRYADYV
jgi:lipopolysaccharide transport system permease protein